MLLILAFFCFSCHKSFIMSDKCVAKYYANTPFKPSFSYLELSNIRLHYAHTSDSTKPVLLLVHGSPGAWFGYKEFFKDTALINNYQIIVPDRLGYNKSTDKLASIDEQASFLKQLLAVLHAQRVSVVGRSYGAAIAVKLVADNPDGIANLLLIAPACNPQKEKFWWFSKPVNSKFLRFFLPRYINRASDEKFVHQAELNQMMPDWEKIKCPVTILQGGKDWIIDATNGRFVDSMLINAPRRFIYLPENEHLLTLEKYELIREILLKK